MSVGIPVPLLRLVRRLRQQRNRFGDTAAKPDMLPLLSREPEVRIERMRAGDMSFDVYRIG
jgi:hypothetical protein